jgi:hypothetical protein
MAIGVAVGVVDLSAVGCLYPSFYNGYNMFSIMTLSLLAYYTFIFIDIVIYTLGSTPWSSRIFWMVG